MHACVRGREVIVNLMIDHGADPQAMDKVHTQYVVIYLVHLFGCVPISERGDMSKFSRNSEESNYTQAYIEGVSKTPSFSGCGVSGKHTCDVRVILVVCYHVY